MMEDTVFALLLRGITERQMHLMEHLANGGAKSYEDYCRATGEYTALQRMEDDIKELEKRFIAD
jgi:predicted nuclease with RNAse H fold